MVQGSGLRGPPELRLSEWLHQKHLGGRASRHNDGTARAGVLLDRGQVVYLSFRFQHQTSALRNLDRVQV